MTKEITSNRDIIDSRDVIKRIDDLQDDLDTLEENVREAREALTAAAQDRATAQGVVEIERRTTDLEEAATTLADAEVALAEWPDSDEGEELVKLKELADEGEGLSDWEHGVALISESYFETYARELADEIGAVQGEGWPSHCIDWKHAAEELQMDYTAVEFDGVTYYAR